MLPRHDLDAHLTLVAHNPDEAFRATAAILDKALTEDEQVTAVHAWLALAEALASYHHTQESDEALNKATALVDGDPDGALLVLMGRARVAAHTDTTHAFTLAAEADAAARALGHPDARIASLSLIIELSVSAEEDQSAQEVAKWLEAVAKAAEDKETMVFAACLRAEALLRLGQNSDALDVARHAHSMGLQHGVWCARSAESRGVAASRMGLLLEAREHFDLAFNGSEGPPESRLVLERTLSHVAFYGSSPQLSEQLEDLCADDDPQVAFRATMASFDLALEAHDLERAAALLDNFDANQTPEALQAVTLKLEIARGDQTRISTAMQSIEAASTKAIDPLLLIDARIACNELVPALSMLDTLIEDERAKGDGAREGAALLRRSIALSELGDDEAAFSDASRAMRLAAARFAPPAYMSAARQVILNLVAREMLDRAFETLDEALEWLEGRGAETRALYLAVFGSALHLEAGSIPEELAPYEALLRTGTLSEHPRAAALSHLSLARLTKAQGHEERAHEHVGSAKALDLRAGLDLSALIEDVEQGLRTQAGSA